MSPPLLSYGVHDDSIFVLLLLTIMMAAVSSEERERYTKIIDDILATADLETISRKKVRQSLEIRLGGQDLSEQKVRTGQNVQGVMR